MRKSSAPQGLREAGSPPPSSADPYPYRTWPYVFVDVNLGVHLITVGQNASSSAPDIHYQWWLHCLNSCW